MNLTPLMKEALLHARSGGDFTLLDCMELLARRADGEDLAVATMRWCGYSLIGYGESGDETDGSMECPACEGFGEIEATGANGRHFDVRCPQCDGDGEVDNDDDDAPVTNAEKLSWKDLHDRSVKVSFEGQITPKWYNHHQAFELVAKTKKAIQERADGAQEAA